MFNFKQWVILVVCSLAILKAEGLFVNITFVRNAVARGAVCLDGSPPAYHLHRGSGTGINSWLIQLEGGGWCNNVTNCLSRMHTRLGSSKKMVENLAFSAILSNKKQYNPDFYNWNRVKVRYCDGSSFTGDVQAVNPATNLHFRGARVWLAVMQELLAKGMRNAENGSAKNLPRTCTSRLTPAMCFFPQYVARQIRTPVFILNAAYDSWQIKNILAPRAADPYGKWQSCQLDIKNCQPNQLKVMQDFRLEFLSAVIGLGRSSSRGMFIDSCYTHCQTETQTSWFWQDSPILNRTTIAKAVGDWVYDRKLFQKIDCPYPLCLDGSAPAYHFDKGFGSGVNNWIVHMEGGGWCTDVASCIKRKGTMKGSSKFMNKDFGFSGILGGKQNTNPDFYNWNRIKVRYCDGSSFTGNVEAVNPNIFEYFQANKLFFRGARVWRAVIDDLMAKGMKNAQNAILSGCSAGALAAILHCDTFRAILPRTARCFFPQYVVPSMRTPLFVINAAFDSWQIKNVLAPTGVDKRKEWANCKLDLKKCSAAQLKTVQGFRDQMMRALSPIHSTPSRGLFLDSCHAHCQGGSAASWSGAKGPQVANTKISKAVGNWFYGRSAFQKIDCPSPICNPTCPAISTDE
ncbi:hypothetical protein Bca4012_087417 [Brassica carinata]